MTATQTTTRDNLAPDIHKSIVGGGPMRASDADRDRVVEQLRTAAGEGCLEATELEERVGAALAARTAEELEPLTADLPARGPKPPSHRPPHRGGSRLQAYLLVMALLVAIWAITGAGYFWPVWPALGWGIGLMGPRGCSRRRRGRAAHVG